MKIYVEMFYLQMTILKYFIQIKIRKAGIRQMSFYLKANMKIY